MGLGHSPRIVTDGLVLCLDAANKRSYPGTGTTWTDKVGGNDGTLTNGPTFDSDNGGSIEFDGTDDSIELSGLDTSLFSGDASLFCFLKTYTSGANSSAKSGIFGFGGSSNSHYTWSNGKIYLDTFRSSRVGPITPSSVDRSIPHSLCITTKSGGQWKLYQNLNLVTSVSAQSSISMSNLRIGWDDGSGYIFRGSFYNFMLYNKELSVEEIRQNYLATKGRYE